MRKGFGLVLCVIVIVMSGVSFVPQSASACSCAMPPPLDEDVERNTAVFSGKVLKITEPPVREIMSSADRVSVLIEVTDVWKGVETSQVVVQTAMSGASCGYTGFEVGGEFLIFARGSSDSLQTGLCSRTAPLSASADVVAQLGESYEPVKQVEPPEVSDQHGENNTPIRQAKVQDDAVGLIENWWVVAAGVAAGIAVVGIVIAMRRKRR